LKRRKIAPGITAVSSLRTVDPGISDVSRQTEMLGQYLTKLEDPNNPLTEVQLPDGTVFKGSYNAPQPIPTTPPAPSAPQIPSFNPPAVIPTRDLTVSQPSFPGVEPPGPLPAPPTPAFGSFGDFLKSPLFRATLGRIAQAIGTTKDYTTIGAQLGKLGEDLAVSQSYSTYLSDLYAGKSQKELAENPNYTILSQEAKAQAMQTFLLSQEAERSGKRLELEERRVGTEERRATDYSKLVESDIAGTISAKDKIKLEEAALALQSKQISHGRFINLNEITLFDTEKMEFIQVPGGNMKDAFNLGQLTPAEQKQFMDFTAADFLNDAKAKYVEMLKEGNPKQTNVDAVRKALMYFEVDEQAGTVNWQKVVSYLDVEQQNEFRKVVGLYVTQRFGGIPASYTFTTNPRSLLQPSPTVQPTPGTKPVVRP